LRIRSRAAASRAAPFVAAMKGSVESAAAWLGLSG
jgi:hypothetical protein